MERLQNKVFTISQYLLNIILLVQATVVTFGTPPIVPTNVLGRLSPILIGQRPFPNPQTLLLQDPRAALNFPNIANYNGLHMNTIGVAGGNGQLQLGHVNNIMLNRRPPLNRGSVFIPNVLPVNEFVNPAVDNVVISTSGDEDEEAKLSADLSLEDDDAMVGGAIVFHQVNAHQHHRLFKTPPPFFLYSNVVAAKGAVTSIPADVIFVIYTSPNLGYSHRTGTAIWHNGLADFINKFVDSSIMGPQQTRIGLVIIGLHGIEALIPMLHNKVYFLENLARLQSSFRGQCSDKGILVAKSLFYQYGRPIAAKRIVLLTDGSVNCDFSLMPGTLLARECGADIIHIKFGAFREDIMTGVAIEFRPFWGIPIQGNVEQYLQPITDRILIHPRHGGWSPWSGWNRCSAFGTCRAGYQMRFRICNSPYPAFGGRPCNGPPAEVRLCRMKHCTEPIVGYWTPWSVFSPCSSNCGPGTKTRTRMCLTFDGQPSVACTGSYVQTRDCVVIECPVQGGWSAWSRWGACSTPCGPGIQIRTRMCDQPFPRYGGALCQGPSMEERVCIFSPHCPIHGGFGAWRKYGGCSVPCGRGQQQLVRACNSPVPAFGGRPCIGRFTMRRPCDTSIICPIPGGWSLWSAFSPCSAQCGVGVSIRRRFCNSPTPMHNGPPCLGPAVEERICHTGLMCPIHGQWSGWIESSVCSVQCGVGLMRRVRFCNSPAPLHGGLVCFGPPTDIIPCDTGISCPVNGGWSLWSDFSPCSANCGVGIMTRYRECNNPVPNGGAYCHGFGIDQRICDTGTNCPHTGMWSQWSRWTFCSAYCGEGTRRRHRYCYNPLGMPGGSGCIGSPIQKEPCDAGLPCPVHGGWSEWFETASCSVTCGSGFTKRVRYCDSPTPMHGGRGCFGPSEKFNRCEMNLDCPIDGGWSFWVGWGVCEGKCGMGIQRRTRVCNNPPPLNLGLDCVGEVFEEKACDTGVLCPVDGRWSEWSVWTACIGDCGVGVMTRIRACDSPKPLYGGLICDGLEKEEMECPTGIMCPVDGGWSLWSPFSPCSVSCGVGIITRVRSCDSPAPLYDGKLCAGLSKEDIICNTQVECPVHGGWSAWGGFSLCSAPCGEGFRERYRECNSPIPLFGGLPCKGDAMDRSPCPGLGPCPVDGQWGSWTEFGPCNVPCGEGIKMRSRLCNNPEPMFGGKICHGFSLDEVICKSPINCPIDGNWSPWGQFSMCSVECGIGVRIRKRLCNNPPPLFNGAMCFGAPLEESECVGPPCPVHGGWSNWSEFGLCGVSCGEGLKRRFRECINPVPLYGGLICEGPSFEDVPCVTGVDCPIHGGYGPWSEWTLCSAPCGLGTSHRIRTCSNPPPQYGGNLCDGISREELTCETGIACPINGGWGPWGDFGICSTDCGAGISQRFRVCDSPVPQYGGLPCPGDDAEGIPCNVDNHCPVDGGFSFWSEWGLCSETCGEGVQTRVRRCDAPVPMYGGKLCVGALIETRVCLANIPCPLHGNWGPWADFTLCSETCGVGVRERFRICDNPVPMYGGLKCEGKPIDIQPCDTGVFCPVHGNWGFWTPWTLCDVKCGVGIQKRHRTCSNPPPEYGGKVCIGDDYQEQVCNSGTPCPINGNWGMWMEWLPCDTECGNGLQLRIRQCDSPLAQYGGLPCAGFGKEERVCDSGVPCPVDGMWSFWLEWSMCSESCGVGVRKRIRTCSNPKPAFGGLICPGPDTEVLECATGIDCPVHGSWTLWSPWTKCSHTCGAGTQFRVRECADPIPLYGGLPCKGPDKELRDCISDCPVHGNWSPWTDGSSCSVTCGLGVIQRKRTCTNPIPAFGGLPCVGPEVDTFECTLDPCPVDGWWAPWNSWSRCQGTCGFGIKVRLRECANPAPSFGGKPCVGIDHETTECDTGIPCPLDGQWSPWSPWGMCLGKCGMGRKMRQRACDSPPPSYGGRKCLGPTTEYLDCDTGIPCPVDGFWESWSGWSVCEADCGTGTQVRIRYCSNPKYGGVPCVGPDKETRVCDSGKPCPVDGGWTLWTKWSLCEGECGMGRQVRLRTCSDPRPMYNGRLCAGLPEEERACETGLSCTVVGEWGLWTMWSTCTVNCGNGIQTRSRVCVSIKPTHMQVTCPGVSDEERACKSVVGCPVNGGWSAWGGWSVCSVTCGQGFIYRYRRCDSPVPQNYGLPCAGPKEESDICDTGVPCGLPGVWSTWEPWTDCSTSCGAGVQYRSRRCDTPAAPGIGCKGWAEDNQICNTDTACPIHGGWSSWTEFGLCKAACLSGPVVRGYRIRRRFCDSPRAQNGGVPCTGTDIDKVECYDFLPCAVPIWGPWSGWSACSADCDEGTSERTRQCVDKYSGLPSVGCVGISRETVTCFERPCPTIEVNCSTECKWDNGIGYAPYPGDCSMFIQCDSLFGEPRVHKCPWGLIYSLEILQCVFPEMSECKMCAGLPNGAVLPYYRTCRSYWVCTDGLPSPGCCPKGQRFNPVSKKCVPDLQNFCKDDCPPIPNEVVIPPDQVTCLFRESSRGPSWYEQEIVGVWVTRPCSGGTEYSKELCGCITSTNGTIIVEKGPCWYEQEIVGVWVTRPCSGGTEYSKESSGCITSTYGTIIVEKECLPELHLTFDTLQQDLDRNIGIHIENVTYLGDGTAHFDGTGAINSNIFSNAEWGRDVYMYIRFKPEGKGQYQGLLHNSGCGPSDIGPSVFMGLDRPPGVGPDKMMMKFAAVPTMPGLRYDFVNITVPDNKLVDAWFKFGDGNFRAEVDGLVAELQVPGRPVARRHGALNIGGNLCRIGNEAFGGFKGILDEVRIYKCKPPR